MVKIRLRRVGTKGRPFYRVVVAPSSAGRNGKFVEVIGTYDPIVKPAAIKIKEDRALHWLMNGAQPSSTTAYILNKVGVLDKYFAERPAAKKQYGFLDKRTAAISVKSVIETPVEAPAPKAKPAPEPEPEVVAVATPEPVEAATEVVAEEVAEVAPEPAVESETEAEVPQV